MNRLFVAVSLATLIWACGGGNQSASLTSPSAPPLSAGPSPTYTLSGVVSEATPAGPAPIEGAQVEESNRHVAARTDRNGFFSLSGLFAGSSSILVSKENYETDRRTVTINGDTRLDIQLRRRPTYTLSGVVSEMTPTGQVPVEGVHVEWSDLHDVSMTDTNGFYSFSGVPAGLNSLWVNKAGYQAGTRQVTITGDTRFDIQLVRR